MPARQVGADYLFIDQLSFMEAGSAGAEPPRTPQRHHPSNSRPTSADPARNCSAVGGPGQPRQPQDGLTLASFSNATEIEATVDMALGLHRPGHARQPRHATRHPQVPPVRHCLVSAAVELTERTDINLIEQITV